MQATNNIIADDVAMLETFRQTYNYAPNMQEATEYLTTTDIYDRLAQNRVLSFDYNYLDNWLTDAGYATTMADMTRFWLFKTQ